MLARLRSTRLRTGLLLLAATLVGPAAASDPAPAAPDTPDLRAATRTARPPTDAERHRLGLEPFHAKCVDMRGVLVLGSANTHDAALLEAAYLMDVMLPRQDIVDGLIKSRTRMVVMAHNEMTTDVPEHADLTPAAFWDKRARGLGATNHRLAVSSAEENLLNLRGDPYATESILIHEFAHAIHEMGLRYADKTFDDRLLTAYTAAKAENRCVNAYGASNHREYWAEGTQSWFDTNLLDTNLLDTKDRKLVNTRQELKKLDPALADLLEEVYGDGKWRYVEPHDRRPRPVHLATFDPNKASTFTWPKEVLEAWDEDVRIKQLATRRESETEIAWLRRRADQDDTEAQFTLAGRAFRGTGIEQSEVLAAAWYQTAADLGDPRARAWLGRMRWLGMGGLERSFTDARRDLLEAANHRVASAQFDLGRMALRGDKPTDIAPDPVEAVKWFDLARRRLHGGAIAEWKKLQKSLTSEQFAEGRLRACRWSPTWN